MKMKENKKIDKYMDLAKELKQLREGCPRGVRVKALACGVVLSELKIQTCCYVHFRTNTLGKGMNPFILPAMG